jgi:hypothetical protein
MEGLTMPRDRSAGDEGDQNIAERVIDRVADAAERIGEAGHAIVEEFQDRVGQLASRLQHEEPTQFGQPVPPELRPVRPKGHGSTWLAWRDDRWVPVHRVKDVGWVWSE